MLGTETAQKAHNHLPPRCGFLLSTNHCPLQWVRKLLRTNAKESQESGFVRNVLSFSCDCKENSSKCGHLRIWETLNCLKKKIKHPSWRTCSLMATTAFNDSGRGNMRYSLLHESFRKAAVDHSETENAGVDGLWAWSSGAFLEF